MDRKPKFRSRKLEYNRPLCVYRFDDSIDLDDYDNPIRAVPLVATGVDKEEEEVSRRSGNAILFLKHCPLGTSLTSGPDYVASQSQRSILRDPNS